MAAPSARPLTGRTAWVRSLARPVRAFVETETGSAAILLAATVAALLWANSPWSGSYDGVWSAELSIRLAGAELSHDLRDWVNDGLMALFFLVVALEIRRELDMGEMRDRRRVALPVLAAIGGMVVPALIYLGFTAGTPAAHGWGTVMATDTAFALGALALVGRGWPLQVRVFLLTLVVVDDVGALLVIAFAYTDDLSLAPLAVAAGLLGVVMLLRRAGIRHGGPYLLLGIGLWLALSASGVHPTLAGVAMGLLATAHPPRQTDMQRAVRLWRTFREQPTSRYASSARRGLTQAISPNERLQRLFHPWASYAIVPLFALANAGVEVSGELLGAAIRSPITLGIVCGLVVGKVIGITGASWLATRRWLGGFPLTLPWPPLVGAAVVAGIGFTVSLFIAELSFEGEELDEAKVGVLAASLLAAALGGAVFAVIGRLPRLGSGGRAVATVPRLVDLADPVDPARDHLRGPAGAPVTLVEYADFQCTYCGQAEPVVRELLREFGADLRYVFRHLPLSDVHKYAPLAAEAAEAAAGQGRFWEMHDLLFAHQDALKPPDLTRYAAQLGLDVEAFAEELRARAHEPRVARDVESAEASGVTGTPSFFVNGRRHHGPFDLGTLSALVRSALAHHPPPETAT